MVHDTPPVTQGTRVHKTDKPLQLLELKLLWAKQKIHSRSLLHHRPCQSLQSPWSPRHDQWVCSSLCNVGTHFPFIWCLSDPLRRQGHLWPLSGRKRKGVPSICISSSYNCAIPWPGSDAHPWAWHPFGDSKSHVPPGCTGGLEAPSMIQRGGESESIYWTESLLLPKSQNV